MSPKLRSRAKIRGGDETSSSGMRMTKTINAINANRLIMKLSTRSIHNPNNFTCFRQIVAHPVGVTPSVCAALPHQLEVSRARLRL
jgi:hypothetical protein